jgi:hypothetical protein
VNGRVIVGHASSLSDSGEEWLGHAKNFRKRCPAKPSDELDKQAACPASSCQEPHRNPGLMAAKKTLRRTLRRSVPNFTTGHYIKA